MARPADYYTLLGVDRTADSETIRRAFRALAREVHPDVSAAPEAGERFRELAQAYRVLSAPNARRLYDHQAIQAGRRPVVVPSLETCVACSGEGGFGPERGQCATCLGSGFVKHASHTSAGRLLRFQDCPDCEGRGRASVAVCVECGGEGRVAVDLELEVVVPAGTRDGDAVALPDRGTARLRVWTPADESGVVRYGAAAALAVAVAFLVFLLFFS